MNVHASRESSTKKIGLVAGGIAAIGLLFGGGFAIGVGNKPEPEVITKTETKTVTEYKTPQACLDYIDYSQESFQYLGESLTLAGDAMTAVGNYDITELNRISVKIKDTNAKLDGVKPQLLAAKADCAAAK